MGKHSKPKRVLRDKIEVFESILFGRLKYHANRRGRYVRLRKEDFIKLSRSNCIYCDCPPSNVIKNDSQKAYKGYRHHYQGVDRKDSSKGYTKENSVPCCRDCNTLKSNLLSFEEMIEIARILKNMRGSKSKLQLTQQQLAQEPLARLATILQRRVKARQ